MLLPTGRRADRTHLAAKQRGRPTITNTNGVKTIRTDTGQIIRAGESFLIGAGTGTEAFKSAQWQANRLLGLNTMRVGVYSASLGISLAQLMTNLDIVVANAAANHMYMMLGYFAVNPGAWVDDITANTTLWTDFWELASARYKDETHVFYELVNEPTRWGETSDYTTAVKDGLKTIFDVMRAGAPNTIIVWPSCANLDPNAQSYYPILADLDSRGNATPVDYTKAAVSYHYYNQTMEITVSGLNNATDGGEAGLRDFAANYPIICTETNWWMEVDRDVLIDAVDLHEEIGIGWGLLRRAGQTTPHEFPFEGDLGPNFLENKIAQLRSRGYVIPVE